MTEKTYVFEVKVTTDTREHAIQAIHSRVGYDEEIEDEEGNVFDYQFSWPKLVMEPEDDEMSDAR